MKTYAQGYQTDREKDDDEFDEGHVHQAIESLGKEKISRMLEDYSANIGENRDDQTARTIFKNSQYDFDVQEHLEISQPGDMLEQQADQVADAFIRGDANDEQLTFTSPAISVSQKDESAGMQTTEEFDGQLNNSKGQGQQLDNEIKDELEEYTGANLDDVTIHTDADANQLSESINAKAFTHGQDIYFKSGNFNSKTGEGKSLLAHEVTHTLQQSDNAQPKIQRAIDRPGSIRILQESYDLSVTGFKADLEKDYLASRGVKLPDDDKLFETYFAMNAAQSFVMAKTENDDLIAKKIPDMVASALTDASDLEVSVDTARALVPAAKTSTKGTEVLNLKKQVFGKGPETLEQKAAKVKADEAALKLVLPPKFQDDPYVKEKREKLETDTRSYSVTPAGKPTQTYFINQSTYASNYKRITNYVNTSTSNSNKAGWLAIGISLYEQFEDYKLIFDRYKYLSDSVSEIATDENKYIENTRTAIGKTADQGHRREYNKIIQLAVDNKDISMDDANIATIHYDDRVNDLITQPTAQISQVISEATFGSTSDKIFVDTKLTGVVLIDKSGLKTVKLGVWAFDSVSYLNQSIDQAIALVPLVDINTLKAKVDPAKEKFYPSAIAFNSSKIKSKRAVKIIQQLIGAPVTGSFDETTVDILFKWQKTNVGKPDKTRKGQLRDIDIDVLFKKLISYNATAPDKLDRASGQFNSALLLVMDYYNLLGGATAMQEEQFEAPGTATATATVQSPDEIFTQMYYERDSDTTGTNEAAATYQDTKLPPFIQIGNTAYESASELATTIAHELTHARQSVSGSNMPTQGREMYAYQMELAKNIGGASIPSKDLTYYIGRIQIGTVTYYWQLPEFEQKLAFRQILQNYVTQGMNRISDYPKAADYKTKVKEYQAAKNPKLDGFVGSITYSTTNPSLDAEPMEAMAMFEMTSILQKTVNVMDQLATSTAEPITAAKISDIETKFNAEFGSATWGFPHATEFGTNYQKLLGNIEIDGVKMDIYLSNFYAGNRNGVIDAINGKGNAIEKMKAWVNTNSKEPEKTDLLKLLTDLETKIK